MSGSLPKLSEPGFRDDPQLMLLLLSAVPAILVRRTRTRKTKVRKLRTVLRDKAGETFWFAVELHIDLRTSSAAFVSYILRHSQFATSAPST
jgi:hypothetical protein